MHDADIANLRQETVAQQFTIVRAATNQSTVCQYGDLSVAAAPLDLFLGSNETASRFESGSASQQRTGVSSRDVRLSVLQHRLAAATLKSDYEQLKQEIDLELRVRHEADRKMAKVITHVTGSEAGLPIGMTFGDDPCIKQSAKTADHECYREVISGYERHCGVFTDYSLQHVKHLTQMCDMGIAGSRIVAAAMQVCNKRCLCT
eukprot:TRINITY_DN1715_c1_g3_i4.p3 TRINITY_DN1715_c1_g3~~TRINITY_DN1715_c1_g3_i4.p3  ORF type:complete len:204 (+),score=65.05 TRINITY_DN1715_c1_g3_i4:833-1444(+)